MRYEEIIQFHGHDCPGLAMGYKMATAAMDGLASLRAEDEELVAIVENDACGVDALQCVTGCTFGKGNLLFRDYGKHVYSIYSRSTRKGVRVYFHGRGIPEALRDNHGELAKWILGAANDSILAVTPISIPEPEPARIMASIPCAICGENVMESRIRQQGEVPTCIPCHEEQ
ncbi:MAG: FmdE family protein [Desulfosarcinaceae bacterium]|nr:FmdE family protein [Desulfosarcinaceae bacterium]